MRRHHGADPLARDCARRPSSPPLSRDRPRATATWSSSSRRACAAMCTARPTDWRPRASKATNLAAPNRCRSCRCAPTPRRLKTVELAVLWSGLRAFTASREDLHQLPAALRLRPRRGNRRRVLDRASHDVRQFHASTCRICRLRTNAARPTSIPLADIDLVAEHTDLLTARAEGDLRTMKEPFFSVVHYGNTHVPYRVDPADSPFQPVARRARRHDENEAYRNYYKNAVSSRTRR